MRRRWLPLLAVLPLFACATVPSSAGQGPLRPRRQTEPHPGQ